MLKFSILLNSLTTLFIMILNFGFKIYLAKEFPKESLIIYYTIIDVFSLISRFFVGYKDALTTLYNESKEKLKIMKLFTVFLMWIVVIVAFIILPVVTSIYLPTKIVNFDFSWWYISLLFISLNLVAFYGYIFLVTKHYKLISAQDMLKTIFWIGSILILYNILNFNPNYKTLIYASIVSNFMILIFLIYKQKQYLPEYAFLKLVGFKLPDFKDDINSKFIRLTALASSNYFIYGLLLFAPVYFMLNSGNIQELGDFQVVARSIYFALVSVFSWPLGRFMFPEFSSLIADEKYEILESIHIRFIKLLFVFGIAVIVLCWLLSKLVISYIFPLEYIDSYKMINILIVALPFVMYQNFSESVIKAVGNYKINLIIKVSGVLFFMISYFILKYFDIKLASIYSFVLGMFGIFFISLYYEFKIKKDWIVK